MVSLSNGSLPGVVSNKRPLENGYAAPNYKPRKVSAIRDFPPGCGRNAVPVNLKPEENGGGGGAEIVEAIGVENSEMTNATEANGVMSPQMADLIGTQAVRNSEMINTVEANGVKTPEIPDVVKPVEIQNSETQNVVGSSGVKNSNIEVDYQSHEAVNCNLDEDLTESLDALVGKIAVNANIVENLVMETGPLGIQLPNEVECERHQSVNNPIDVERAEPLDALVGEVTTTTLNGFPNGFNELLTETKINGVDTLDDMQDDSPKNDTDAGDHTMLKELNEVEGLASVQNSGVEKANSKSDGGDSVGKELVLGNPQASSLFCDNTKPETSIRCNDKYRIRRVSAVRDFPPHCGRNVSLPSADVGVAPELTMPGNVSEEGTNGRLTSPQNACVDGLDSIHVKGKTTETLNDGAGRGTLGEMTEATAEGGLLMDFEESIKELQNGIVERMEARQAVPESGTKSTDVVSTSIEDTSEPLGKEIAVHSPDGHDKVSPPHGDLSMGNESHKEVVYGLMAAPHCPWRKSKVALDNPDGRTSGSKVRKQNLSRLRKSKAVSLKSNLKADPSGGPSLNKIASPDSYGADRSPGPLTGDEDYSGAHDELVHEITPISMFKPVIDSDGNDSEEPVGKDLVVYSPGENVETRTSPTVLSSADEVDREVVHDWRKENAALSKSDRGINGEKKMKTKLSWRQMGKVVAKKSTPKAKFSESPSKKRKEVHISGDADEMHIDDDDHDDDNCRDGGFPTNSPASHKSQNFEVSVPPLGRNISGHSDARKGVREALRLFNAICRKLLHHEEANSMPDGEGKSKQSGKKKLNRIDLQAAKAIKEKGIEVNMEKQILGHVPGVEVGDEFQYRVELAIVGIHRLYQAGIDSMKVNGMPVATSIVSSGAYDDDVENADVLIYSGQGGNVVFGKSKEPEDQKLERGNLALKNSISAQTPVRVVRGWKENIRDPLNPRPKQVTTYVYDGLYTVTKYWRETGNHGKQVLKFELKRNPGQPELAWKELKKSSKSKTRPGACVKDISGGKEPFAICAVNTLDDEKPPSFNYITKMMYPTWHHKNPPAGCDCTGKCSDSKKCMCAVRNGGQIPYNRNGALVETKNLVFECGPHCKCPPSCYNRVSQRGIRFQLEIFKTESRGWGVRPLTSLPSGSFVCEYAGELLEDKEAEQRIGNDEYLFDIGQKYSNPSLNSDEQDSVEHGEEIAGYTIDAAEYGNVGRFINHSCSPNLYAQNVVYDHEDRKMPHVMLFAMENIPPLQELTYDYNYSVGQIRDSNGNVKIKKCYCGAAQCSGRMY